MLELLSKRLKREQLFEKMRISNQTKNRSKYLDPLIKIEWIEKEFPDNKTNPNQTYQASESGKKILSLISKGKYSHNNSMSNFNFIPAQWKQLAETPREAESAS